MKWVKSYRRPSNPPKGPSGGSDVISRDIQFFVTAMTRDNWVVFDRLTGTVYPQPNKLIAHKVAEMHGQCDVMSVSDFIERGDR